MNLADYLSDLLEEKTEVSVPGLGYFVREHIGAVYNEAEGRFYPPHHKIRFVADQKADDALTEYVAKQKNISLASSKYFAEKFVNKLYEDVTRGKQLFSNLGVFHLSNNQLVFESNNEVPNDPDFYGLPAIQIAKLAGTATVATVEPVILPPVADKQVEAATTTPEQEYNSGEPKTKRSSAVWVILLAALLVLIVAAYGIYKLNPGLANRIFPGSKRPVVHKKLPPPPPPEVRRDTVKYIAPASSHNADTMARSIPVLPVVPDTVNNPHFELIIAKLPKNAFKKAAAAVKRFQSESVEARITSDVPGPMIKISAGVFANKTSADSLRTALLKAKKIKVNSIVIKVNPKK